MIPRIIHTIHFNWDVNQVIPPGEPEFDQTHHLAMCEYAQDFDVRLWTHPQCREFCLRFYPHIWDVLQRVSRPVMMIDVLRWLVVHHFGGIYWQMRTIPLVAMDQLLPAVDKRVRLFTENEQTPAQCQAMAAEPIRGGKPEEPIRILNQVFSAAPGTAFVEKTIAFLLRRIEAYVPRRDYDVLYISANAAVSEAYDQFGQQDPDVERINLVDTRRMFKWRYGGTWRKDKAAQSTFKPPPAKTYSPAQLDRIPGLSALVYRWLRVHPHETMLAQRDAVQPRTSCLPHVGPLIERLGIQTVFEAPCGKCASIPKSIHYVGGDPNRAMVAANRKYTSPYARFRQVNMLYSRFPKVDLFICPDFLEWLSYIEGLRVLRRILATARPRYLALTGYRVLGDAWNTALGDFRPICYDSAPFEFSKPLDMVSLESVVGGRPDRCLMIWRMDDFVTAVQTGGRGELAKVIGRLGKHT